MAGFLLLPPPEFHRQLASSSCFAQGSFNNKGSLCRGEWNLQRVSKKRQGEEKLERTSSRTGPALSKGSFTSWQASNSYGMRSPSSFSPKGEGAMTLLYRRLDLEQERFSPGSSRLMESHFKTYFSLKR